MDLYFQRLGTRIMKNNFIQFFKYLDVEVTRNIKAAEIDTRYVTYLDTT